MPENQNPVFTDDTLVGDGTEENPLGAKSSGSPSVGAKGTMQLSDGAGGFEQPADESSDNQGQFSGPVYVLVAASIFIQNPPGGATGICTQFASGTLTLGNGGNALFLKGSLLNIANLQTFANNADAIAGGLTSGDAYLDGGDPNHLCIVT